MGNTRAEAAYLRALAAFKTPTLDLLHGRYAPFVVAVLSVVFTPDRPTVAVSDAHAEVAEILDELRAAGYEGDDRPLPTGTAREICRRSSPRTSISIRRSSAVPRRGWRCGHSPSSRRNGSSISSRRDRSSW